MLPVSIAMFITSAVGSRLSSRFTVRAIVRAGLWTTLVAAVALLATIQPTLADGAFKASMALLGVGMGLIVSQLGNVVQSSVDASGRGEAGGLQYTGQQLGSSLGVALIGSIVLIGLAERVRREHPGRRAHRCRDRGPDRGVGRTRHRLRALRPGRGRRPGRRHRRRHRHGRSSRTTRTPRSRRSRPACWPRRSWPCSPSRSPVICPTTHRPATRTHPTTPRSPCRHDLTDEGLGQGSRVSRGLWLKNRGRPTMRARSDVQGAGGAWVRPASPRRAVS